MAARIRLHHASLLAVPSLKQLDQTGRCFMAGMTDSDGMSPPPQPATPMEVSARGFLSKLGGKGASKAHRPTLAAVSLKGFALGTLATAALLVVVSLVLRPGRHEVHSDTLAQPVAAYRPDRVQDPAITDDASEDDGPLLARLPLPSPKAAPSPIRRHPPRQALQQPAPAHPVARAPVTPSKDDLALAYHHAQGPAVHLEGEALRLALIADAKITQAANRREIEVDARREQGTQRR